METQDVWSRIENNLAALKQAGTEIVGEELKPESYGGGASREEQHREYVRAELRRKWAFSWKTMRQET